MRSLITQKPKRLPRVKSGLLHLACRPVCKQPCVRTVAKDVTQLNQIVNIVIEKMQNYMGARINDIPNNINELWRIQDGVWNSM